MMQAMRVLHGVLGLAVHVVFWAACATLGAAAALVAAAAAPVLFGLQSAIVISGSMEPTLAVGSVVVAGSVSAQDVRVGDIITYSSASQPGVLVTHRVVGVQGSGPTLRLRTKGDANSSEDAAGANLAQPIARLIYSVPLAGYLLTALSEGNVRLLVLGVALLLFWMRSAHGAPGGRRKASEGSAVGDGRVPASSASDG